MGRNVRWLVCGVGVIALCGALGRVAAGAAGAAVAANPNVAAVNEVLRRQTQQLYDAVALGNRAVWERYVGEEGLYTAEDGTLQNRGQMMAAVKPLPAGVSGQLKVIDFNTVLHGTTAIFTYVVDEYETYHGARLHCQYRSTDTWMQTAAGWRLVAGQAIALRTDPPAMPLPERQLAEYHGTYILAPGVQYDIRGTGSRLEGQQSGHKPETLLAEAPDVLFAPGKPRYRMIFQRDAAGRISGFAERREAWSILWKREK
jgi:hypothetical protein